MINTLIPFLSENDSPIRQWLAQSDQTIEIEGFMVVLLKDEIAKLDIAVNDQTIYSAFIDFDNARTLSLSLSTRK